MLWFDMILNDKKNIRNMSDYFETVSKLEAIKLDKKRITLCHYPN